MKAIILAAGLGTRLKPLTDRVPKVMVPIGGKPLLEYHLDELRKHGIKEILINTHYLPQQIEDYVTSYNVSHPDGSVSTIHEEKLLGSAGTVIKNEVYFEKDECILVVYGDNFTNIDYSKLISFHKSRHSRTTIVCNQIENIQEKGMIVFGQNDRITNFKEKPSIHEIVSNYSNCGIYVINTDAIRQISPLVDESQVIDFGKHVFPLMLEHDMPMLVFKLSEWLIDVGNPENYKIANEIANKLNK